MERRGRRKSVMDIGNSENAVVARVTRTGDFAENSRSRAKMGDEEFYKVLGENGLEKMLRRIKNIMRVKL